MAHLHYELDEQLKLDSKISTKSRVARRELMEANKFRTKIRFYNISILIINTHLFIVHFQWI